MINQKGQTPWTKTHRVKQHARRTYKVVRYLSPYRPKKGPKP